MNRIELVSKGEKIFLCLSPLLVILSLPTFFQGPGPWNLLQGLGMFVGLMAGMFGVFGVARLALTWRRWHQVLTWDKEGVRMRRSEDLLWEVTWQDYYGFRRSDRGTVVIHDRSGREYDTRTSPVHDDFEQTLRVLLPPGGATPETVFDKPLSKRVRSFLVMNGLGLTGLLGWAIYQVIAHPPGDVAHVNFWGGIATACFFGPCLLIFGRINRRRRVQEEEVTNSLLEEWELPAFQESTYSYPDDYVFLLSIERVRARVNHQTIVVPVVLAACVMVVALTGPNPNFESKAFTAAVVALPAATLACIIVWVLGTREIALQQALKRDSQFAVERLGDRFLLHSSGHTIQARQVKAPEADLSVLRPRDCAGAHLMILSDEERKYYFDPFLLRRLDLDSLQAAAVDGHKQHAAPGESLTPEAI